MVSRAHHPHASTGGAASAAPPPDHRPHRHDHPRPHRAQPPHPLLHDPAHTPPAPGSSAGDPAVASTIAEYQYDAQGRRIKKSAYTGDGLDNVEHDYYTGWSVVETRNGSDIVTQQHVWDNLAGHYIDSLAQTLNDTDESLDGTLEDELYALQDQQYNLLAITNDAGQIVERYEYTLYGERTVMTPQHAVRGDSAHGMTIGFQGLLHDAETGLIQNRRRPYSPRLGRFYIQDPHPDMYPDGMNAYAAYHVMRGGVDPLGLDDFKIAFYGAGAGIGEKIPAGVKKTRDGAYPFAIIPGQQGNGDFRNIARAVGTWNGQIYLSKSWEEARDDLFNKLDTNTDMKIKASEIKGHTFKIYGYSWGGHSAVRLSNELWLPGDKKSVERGDYELCVDIPIDPLYVIDSVKRILRNWSPETNVVNFYNYYQTKGGEYKLEYQWTDPKNPKNIVIEEVTGGSLLSRNITGDRYDDSNAQNNHQMDVNATLSILGRDIPLFSRSDNVVLNPNGPGLGAIPAGANVTRTGIGSEMNHDTMPWLMYDDAIQKLR